MVLSEDVLAVDLDAIPYAEPRPTLIPSATEDPLHGLVEPHPGTLQHYRTEPNKQSEGSKGL